MYHGREYYSNDTVENDYEYDHYEKMLKLLENGTYKVYQCRGLSMSF
jgi:hypothetical protein